MLAALCTGARGQGPEQAMAEWPKGPTEQRRKQSRDAYGGHKCFFMYVCMCKSAREEVERITGWVRGRDEIWGKGNGEVQHRHRQGGKPKGTCYARNSYSKGADRAKGRGGGKRESNMTPVCVRERRQRDG